MSITTIVGLTGGIASGKSTVSKYICEQGFPVFDADASGHALMQPNEPAWLDIVQTFGSEILLADQQIDRKKLGTIVFADPDKLKLLEMILHKRIRQQGYAFIEQQRQLGHQLIVLDVPLLIEAGWYEQVDEVWLVALDRQEQIARAMQRDNLSAAAIIQRIDKQMQLADKKKYATHIIDNSGSIEYTIRQVDRLLSAYKNK